jgi:hypothetical protein
MVAMIGLGFKAIQPSGAKLMHLGLSGADCVASRFGTNRGLLAWVGWPVAADGNFGLGDGQDCIPLAPPPIAPETANGGGKPGGMPP